MFWCDESVSAIRESREKVNVLYIYLRTWTVYHFLNELRVSPWPVVA